MKYTHNTSQKTCFDCGGYLQVEIPQEHGLMRLERELNWEEMEEIVMNRALPRMH